MVDHRRWPSAIETPLDGRDRNIAESPPDVPRLVVHAPPVASKPPHFPHLDSLRGIASLMVVLHHARLESRPSPGLDRAFAWLNEGHFCVTFFVLLSGYCLSLPTLDDGRLKGGARDFLIRRAWRLLPAYYAALIGSIALVATVIGQPTARHWDFALPLSPRAVVTHVLMVHNFSIATILKINHVFWSIAVEWQLYFSLPLLLWMRREIGPWAATGLAVAIGYAGHSLVAGTDRFGLMPHYYGVFALGMLAAVLSRGDGKASAVRAAIVAVISVAGWLAAYRGSTYEVLDLPFSIAGAAVLVLLARPGRARSVLGWRPMVWLGGCSYSLYLIHAPLQHLIIDQIFARYGLPPHLEFPILAFAATPILVVLGHAFSIAFERPFLPARPATTSAVPPRSHARPPSDESARRRHHEAEEDQVGRRPI